ncbi:branched-chain amino acid ABC transporter permease [Agromyces rhizosphaerae]|uniref:Branched-chain amino acid ABC transporter permease n=1 Tax=Agromyces rhizosphaerae TaxID=88374 RepID=A0A9W6CUT3_9MICO|nr:branched-chain amino acid ABC transporter permease [Agromyces rhizosphaerae]GLI26770.1 branched-chain amino acid ABC transporter permease [Agromyces rhizosphaerae]
MDVLDSLLGAFQQAFSPVTAAFALAAIGLNIHFGYTGLLNFGQAGFVAIGAYAFAIGVVVLGLPWWAALLLAVAGAIGFALLLGAPTLRLRGDYLAIVTIAAAEIVRYTVNSSLFDDVTGGAQGITNNPSQDTDYSTDLDALNPLPAGRITIGDWVFTSSALWWAIVTWTVVAIVSVIVWRLMRSPWGLTLRGVREDQEAMRSLGKNVNAIKMQALIIGGVIGAIAGVLLIMPASVAPADYNTRMTFNLFTIVLLGGAATILGPIVGSLLFWVLLQVTDRVITLLAGTGALDWFADAAQLRFSLVGLALILLVLFRPQGLLGDRKEMSFARS